MKKAVIIILAAIFILTAAGCGGSETAAAKVTGRVLDGETGCVCGIEIENTQTSEKDFALTDENGAFDLRLGEGEYRLTFVKDSQYLAVEREVRVENGAAVTMADVRLTRLFTLADFGYRIAELHQHSVYSDGSKTPSDMRLYDVAMGMDFAALTDHDSVSGNAEFTSGGTDRPVTIGGVEISSGDKGHINALGTTNTYDSNFRSADDVKAVIAQAKADGAYVQINHPARSGGKGFAYIDDLPDFGFDGYELWNGRNAPSPLSGTNLKAKQIWLDYLAEGFYIPATAGSDNHGYDVQNVGMPRTYARSAGESADDVISAIKAGHSFLSDGPVIFAEIDGKSYGETVAPGEKTLSLTAFHNSAIGKVNVLVSGGIALTYDVGSLHCSRLENITLAAGDYVILEIISADGGYAITNPIFCE